MKQASSNQPRRETIRLDQLVRHPKQDDFFERPTQDAVETLADDIRRNGLREPIEVLPPAQKGRRKEYQILSGHTRKEALELLGRTEVEVIVRYDLRDADADEVECHLLEANQNRRHLDKLTQARIAKRLYMREKRATRGRLSSSQQGELRELIGKKIGMSGRNLDRYMRLLDTPIEVQNAFCSGKLSLVLAGKVAGLNAKDQQVVAGRIRAGETPKVVLEDYFTPTKGRHVKVADAMASIVRGLERGQQDLADRIDEVSSKLVKKHMAGLKKGKRFLGELMARADTDPAT